MRNYSLLDTMVLQFHHGLATVFGKTPGQRMRPDLHIPAGTLTAFEQKQVQRFLRINHCGEICAQALYQGQALTARDPKLQAQFRQAAQEEHDHLHWCATRLEELKGRQSVLNPVWYLGSLSIGAFAGWCKDPWSLGFLAETERQVEAHLDKHLKLLPAADKKTQAIFLTMQADEQKHGADALQAGGYPLPPMVKWLMKGSAKIMTTIAYWV